MKKSKIFLTICILILITAGVWATDANKKNCTLYEGAIYYHSTGSTYVLLYYPACWVNPFYKGCTTGSPFKLCGYTLYGFSTPPPTYFPLYRQ